LGGDSILSIQIIARANQQGLQFTLKQLFQYQTIEDLSAVVNTSPVMQIEQGLVQGDAPLTPIQQWFFAQQFRDQHHWNQSQLLEMPASIHYSFMEQAVYAVFEHHDVLRLRFVQDEGTGWRQYYTEADETIPMSL